MKTTNRSRRRALLTSAAAPAIAIALWAGSAAAQEPAKTFAIAPQPLADALLQLSRQADIDIVASTDLTRGRVAPKVAGEMTTADAMSALLAGSGLVASPSGAGYIIARASDPQSGSAAGDGADGTVQALVVTAQKREENIQDVPIAMSAFTQEDLTRSQVAGGPDLMTQVPNMTFTKTNFSGYSIQIRGIGTQAISATTDAAVAVAFNNTPFIRNRFFEQEFYDLQRVEVLRGPQGTLYGRNATAGVVNLISQKPKFGYEAKLSGDVANYNSTRLEGMLNVPLAEDKVALRLAGAWTKREGYSTNQITGNPIDGRDLWSTRLSLRFAPTDRLEANLIWEHFEEDDDRLRSGKQLCHTHEVTEVAGFPTTHYQTLPEVGQPLLFSGVQASFSQGCIAESLYSPDSFQTPNGISLPYYVPLGAISVPIALDDPYISRTQSTDLRVIESTVDPKYRAKSDLAELQVSLHLSENLNLSWETAYSADGIFSIEDYNRFNTAPGAFLQAGPDEHHGWLEGQLLEGPNGGIFCDPQIGCADRLVAIDLSTAKSRHFSQEFRLSSDYDGPFNFSVGANFLRYDTEDKYYVFVNTLSLYSVDQGGGYGSPYVRGLTDNHECLRTGFVMPDPQQPIGLGCGYLDPNPVESLNDLGHNYFLSKNPYKLISYAAFGEFYYDLTPNLTATMGLRWTVDKKEAPLIPSWVVAEAIGYPVQEVIRQTWREPTGRLALDWKPDLTFTDETLLYASYAHGYKAGGANPPPTGITSYNGVGLAGTTNGDAVRAAASATHPKTFGPEFVNAFEVGAKNTLLDGRLVLNGSAFYYDYAGYQISQIVDRSAVNLNFDASVWGLELETDWRPVENLRVGLKLGYESTSMADGSKAIDLMDRTAGHADWVVVRPFPTRASSCILPAWLFVGVDGGLNGGGGPDPHLVNLGGKGGGNAGPCEIAYDLGRDPVTDAPYVDLTNVQGPIPHGDLGTPAAHPGYAGWNPAWAPNNGEGFDKDLSGNELPNAPHFTATITADYTLPLPNDWLMTLHSDFYYQSEAWTRIFNTEGYDKLKAYTNVNLAAIFTNEDAGWKVMAYVKNVFDRDSITGAFLNSDDTGLTTNVFLTEPRLYGLRVTKEWSGGPWWTGSNAEHSTGEPYPITVEVGGQVQRHDASAGSVLPSFAPAFSAALPLVGPNLPRLDWGDGREVTLTFRPTSQPWRLAATYRSSQTNSDISRNHAEEAAGPRRCWRTGFFGRLFCDPDYVFDNGGTPVSLYNPRFLVTGTNWSDSSARYEEGHELVDFRIGVDAGLGLLPAERSSIEFGLRLANIHSSTIATVEGIPDLQLPEGWNDNPAPRHRYSAELEAAREFVGAGPLLSWSASQPLWGDRRLGELSMAWSATAGVLFGKQRVHLAGYEQTLYANSPYWHQVPPVSVERSLVDESRATSRTVPVLDLSLGLSYELQRIKLSTGYRWERYFDVLDVGQDQHKDADRTIDGPYFKIAVGFGG